jgi:hypothetical protein
MISIGVGGNNQNQGMQIFSCGAAIKKILSFRSFSRKMADSAGIERKTSLAGCTPN